MTITIQIGRLLTISAVAGVLFSLGSCRPAVPALIRPVQPGETVYFVPNTNRMVALTFDDGPNGAATEQILDTLKRFNVPATFFLIGTNVLHYPDLAQRIAREGHVIGNHTFSHPRFDRIPADEISREITAGATAITGATGVKPILFRPPYGINGPGLEEICRREGCFIAGWSAHASDWNRHSAVEIAECIISQVTTGDILLLHDGWETRHDVDRQNTVDAVPLILERLTREGFRFVTLPELLRHMGPSLAEFSNGVRLLGLHVQSAPKPVHPGDDRYIRYFWNVPAGWNPQSARAFVHFESGGGFRFQDDHAIPPSGDVRDLVIEHVLIIPSNAPPGHYQCRLGLFDPAHPDVNHRLPVRSAALYRKGAVILPDLYDIQVK